MLIIESLLFILVGALIGILTSYINTRQQLAGNLIKQKAEQKNNERINQTKRIEKYYLLFSDFIIETSIFTSIDKVNFEYYEQTDADISHIEFQKKMLQITIIYKEIAMLQQLYFDHMEYPVKLFKSMSNLLKEVMELQEEMILSQNHSDTGKIWDFVNNHNLVVELINDYQQKIKIEAKILKLLQA